MRLLGSGRFGCAWVSHFSEGLDAVDEGSGVVVRGFPSVSFVGANGPSVFRYKRVKAAKFLIDHVL